MHQRNWDAKASNVTAILPSGVVPPGATAAHAPLNIAAIVSGCIGGVVLIAVIVVSIIMGRRHHKKTKLEEAERHQSESSMRGFAQPPQSPYPPSTYLGSSMHDRSMHAKSISPSSLWDQEPPPRPDSPTSFYQSEYDPVETQTISGFGAPMPFGTRSMAFSAVDFPMDYEPTIMGDRNSHIRGSQLEPLPFFEATAMPKPIVVSKSKDEEKTEFVCELPAREQVGKDRLNFSKKPTWI